MRTHVVLLALFALATVGVVRVARADVPLDGGDPPYLLYYSEEEEPSGVDIAIASDGTQFVAYSARSEVDNDEEVTVLRSTTGGNSWEVWDVLADAGSNSYVDPKMKIIGSGTEDEQVVVAFREYSVRSEDVLVAYAEPFSATPTWTTRNAISFDGDPFADMHDFDLAVGLGEQTVVAVAAVAEVDDELFWHFNVSLNSSLNFGTDQVIFTDTSPADAWNTTGSVAIALHDKGGDDRVHMVLGLHVEPEVGTDETEIFQTGADTWGIFGGFDPPSLVTTRDREINLIDLAADIEGDDMVFTATPVFEGFTSTNGGTNWLPLTLPEVDSPYPGMAQVEYLPTGFVLWGDVRLTGTRQLRDFRPISTITGAWSTRSLLHNYSSNPWSPSGLADDPTRPGETAVVGNLSWNTFQERGVWFNGTWRDAPGYGINEGRVQYQGWGDFVAAPAVGDLDGDGDGEIVTAVRNADGDRSHVLVFQHDIGQGEYLRNEVLELSEASAPALFDVDDDGDLEIFVGSARGGIRGFDHELNVLAGWPVDLPGSGDTWVSVAPVTGTSYGEIVAAHADRVHLFDPAGSERAGWPFLDADGGEVVGRAAIGDVDDDGSVEVVAAFTTAVAIIESDGTLQRLLEGPWIPSAGVSLADLDGDGDLEIAGPMSGGTLVVVNHDGTFFDPAFPFDTGTGAALSSVSIADVETSGEPVLCFTAGDQLFAIRGDGTALPGYPSALSPSPSVVTEPIIGRVARPNTDRPQLVLGAEEGRIHVVTANGETPRDWPRQIDEANPVPVAIVDVDADGINELITATGILLSVMDMGTEVLSSQTRRWPQAGHDKSRSGCSDCIPRAPASVEPSEDLESDDPRSAALVEFTGVSPNPSTGPTNFRFALSARAHVELTIYDPSGRRVRSLAHTPYEAGTHAVAWDATDSSDRPVAAGTYFARMRVVRGAESMERVERISILH